MSSNEVTFSGPYDSAFDVIEDRERAANMKVRSKLASRLTAHVEGNDLDQKQAAAHLKVDQSRVSRLLNGHISDFTIDALINMCYHAGISVDVIFDEEDVYAGRPE